MCKGPVPTRSSRIRQPGRKADCARVATLADILRAEMRKRERGVRRAERSRVAVGLSAAGHEQSYPARAKTENHCFGCGRRKRRGNELAFEPCMWKKAERAGKFVLGSATRRCWLRSRRIIAVLLDEAMGKISEAHGGARSHCRAFGRYKKPVPVTRKCCEAGRKAKQAGIVRSAKFATRRGICWRGTWTLCGDGAPPERRRVLQDS